MTNDEREKWHNLAVSMSQFVDWCYEKHPDLFDDYANDFHSVEG